MAYVNYFNPLDDHRLQHGSRINDCIFPYYVVGEGHGQYKSLEEAVAAIVAYSGKPHQQRKKRNNKKHDDSPSSSDDEDYKHRRDRSHQLIENLSLQAKRENRHHNQHDNDFPRTIVLPPGLYEFPPTWSTEIAINVVSISQNATPDVILEGKVTSGGNKSFAGIKFRNVKYTVEAESEGAKETFHNCVFGENSQFKANNSKITFFKCLANDRFSGPFFTQKGKKNVTFQDCDMTFARTQDETTSLFELNGSGSETNLFKNCKICFNTDECPSANSKRFFPISTNAQKPLEILDSQFILETNESEVVIVGSCEDKNGANISIINSIFSNNNEMVTNVSLLGFLWGTTNTTNNMIGSIYISRCTLRNVRLLYFGQSLCCHNQRCTGQLLGSCSHCNSDITGWENSITVTSSDLFMFTANSTVVSSLIDIQMAALMSSNVIPMTNWYLSLLNCNIFVNNMNVPITIQNINNLTLNLSGTTFTNLTLASQVNNMPAPTANNNNNIGTIINNIVNSITGNNPNNAVVTGSNTNNLVVAPPWIQISNVSGTSSIIISGSNAAIGFARALVNNSNARIIGANPVRM